MQLPEAFVQRLQSQLGEAGFAAYMAAMEEPPVRGLRVNTLKITPAEFQRLAPFPLRPVPGLAQGFILAGEEKGIGNSPLHRAGLFYMQEPSAMGPAALLSPEPGMRVLDLCAAPGGKAGHLAAYLKGEGLLIANEITPSRAQILARTLERLGVRNAMVTSMNPQPLCEALAGWCDGVLVDAPCSGEGMFRKDETAIAEWSPAHVAACAQRQRKILDSAALAVRPGGRLVYSTCTFAREEDEETVQAFLEQHPDFFLLQEERRWPHTFPGEGHYMALLQREERAAAQPAAPRTSPGKPNRKKGDALAPYHAFVEETFVQPPHGTPTLLPDGRVMLLPDGLPAGYEKFRIISCGVQAGEIRGSRFLPAHSLFLGYPLSAFRQKAVLDGEKMKIYLAGGTPEIPETLRGYCPVAGEGMDWPLGFGKAVDGILKNHLPKGIRE